MRCLQTQSMRFRPRHSLHATQLVRGAANFATPYMPRTGQLADAAAK